MLPETTTIRLPLRSIAAFLLALSLVFFYLGLTNPIMKTEILMGFKNKEAYLFGSVQHFFDTGETFIGMLILLFSIIFPALKYLVLLLKITNVWKPKGTMLAVAFEVINKWAMLDVFIVALVITNMKFDSNLIYTQSSSGTTYFAVSVILMMACTFILMRLPKTEAEALKEAQ